MPEERVFLSAVSGEFRAAREGLARLLAAAGYEVMEQGGFHLSPDDPTLLGKLHGYIRDCQLVICLLGPASGFVPPDAAAKQFLDRLPADVDKGPWSYTQWEGFFAEHFNRRILRVPAAKTWLPGPPDARQALYLTRHIDHLGSDLTVPARNDEHVVLEAAQALGLVRLLGKPEALPFLSIGDLFIGREPFMARLRASLTRAANTPVAIRAVQGIGGIGKTRRFQRLTAGFSRDSSCFMAQGLLFKP